MIIVMRYAIVVLVILTLACSKKESPPESSAAAETQAPSEAAANPTPTPQAEPAKTERPALDPPTVKLVAAGKPPLQKVRWQFSEGASEVLEMTIAQVIVMEGGGWDNRYVPISIAQTIELSTRAAPADGTAEVALLVREVEELETKDANSGAIVGGKGATGTYKVDSTGVMHDLVLVTAPDSVYKGSDLDALRGLLRLTVFPVPSEAIGVGAKWTVTQGVFEHQTVLTEQMAIELVERAGSELTLRVEVKSTGSREATLADGHKQAISLDIDTKFLAKLSLSKLAPRSSDLEQQTLQKVRVPGADEATGQLDITIDRTVTMRSK